ncbi:MAG: DUF2778 domain-containing protein [Alphaproteobacteria bacterium]|nr:DUF2778 domain-containing protein [Alphaproteobacteria bacterium]
MYSSYLTRETFENEHDEKMTRKFSYNYQVLKRLFPEVYKLPESEIRSLVHSIYDNPKMGDELLDHLSDVINKKKPEWGEYLNPKPEEAEQPVQDNPLQPVQPKPLNTGSGFEPYKPQKSAFGLGNTGGFGGLNNTNNFGTTGGLKQSQLPDLTKGMDLKHSDMVTGFGINEAKQNSMLGTGFSMPKLPKMPQFPKAREPQMEANKSYPLCYMNFDGQNLNLYRNNQQVNSLDAMSGKAGYQARMYQNMMDKGPLPEGIYYANQDQRQNITPLQALLGITSLVSPFDFGKWPGTLPAWGLRRIWLQPDANNTMYGRDNFSIHGGLSKGSAGCIDIPWQTDILSNYMDGCQDSVPLYVKYPQERW